MEGHDAVVVSVFVDLQLVVLDEVGSEFGDVHHLGSSRVFKDGPGDR